jgi:hypothetical protein
MEVNKEIVAKFNPCKDRFENFTSKYPDFSGNFEEFSKLGEITYSDKIWVLTKFLNKDQGVKAAIKIAKTTLNIFESKYPDDKRPRQALEAAEKWLNEPTEANRDAAYTAADAAAAAADAAAAAAAADAAAAAAYAAAAAAAYAAAAAAAYAADAAAYAADAAAAYAAAREAQEDLNLKILVEVLNGN